MRLKTLLQEESWEPKLLDIDICGSAYRFLSLLRQIDIESATLVYHSVNNYMLLMRYFTEEAKDPYEDRTHMINFELHQN